MSLAGHLRDSRGNVCQGGMEVAAGDRGRGVPGEGLGDRVAGDAPDAGDGRVAQHLGRQRRAGVPAEMVTSSGEEAVVAASGDRLATPGPEHGIVRAGTATIGGVDEEERDQGWGGGLFSGRVVLLAKPHGGAGRVDVPDAQIEGALDAGAGLEMEPHQQKPGFRSLW